ncbi:MAG TPA: tetratricopeptide repeat protein [Thermoplasmata archaeon]|nr:tetratricopeptide repeat protein [Thermoplasmata archaeon]
MTDATPSATVAEPAPIAEVRERYRALAEAETRPDRDQYLSALKAFLATVEGHAKELMPEAGEVAPQLAEVAMALYRASQPDLARRAVDLGLELAPGTTALLHDKALILLAQNQDLPTVVSLVDQALEGNPHDKGLWATRGDALRLQGHPEDAAEAYLHAQRLDASSTQYVDRALKLVPHHPKGLRMKVDLARAHGGELEALQACDELLKENADDLDLLLSRAELLAALGQADAALEPLERVRKERPADRPAALLQLRILYQLGRAEAARPLAEAFVTADPPPEGAAMEELAHLAEPTHPEVALSARERLKEIEPRNVQNLLELRALAVRLDRVEVALGACQAVLAVQPDNLEAMRSVAELEVAAGHPDLALRAYREVAKAHPRAVGELRKALEVARSSGDAAAAREFAERILAEEPADQGAEVELARTLTATGDFEGAKGAYDALLKSHPGDLSYLLEKKEVVAQAHDTDQLASVLDELFRLDPTRTDVAVERGHLYLAFAYDEAAGSAEREKAARTALVSYERASSDPEAVDVSTLGIARASRLVDDPDRALHAYAEFLARPENAGRNDIWKELGHAARETGRYAEAAEAYRRAIEAGLEEPDLFWGAVEVHDHLNQDARALQLVDLLLAREPGNPLFLRKKGQLLLKTGRREEALRTLQYAVDQAQGDPHAYFEVAEALRAQGAYADSITYYRRGLEIDPKNRHGRLALAETLLLAGQYPESVRLVDPLLKEDPNDLAAWKARADAWRALGRNSEVLYSLRAILLLEPENGPALLELYRLHREAGATKEAYEAVTQLLSSTAPEAQDATLHLERADLAAKLGLSDEANASYARAAEIDPANRVEISVRRARLRLTAGRPDLALELLDEGLKAVPEGTQPTVSALLLRAEILGALERSAEARQVFEEVLRREPKSPVALAGVAKTMLAEGKHAEAVEFLRAALPQVPPQESLYLLLAEAESGLAHLDRASEAIHKGVEILPKSVALWVRLGELGIAQQTWPEAAQAYAHALALDPSNVEALLRAGFVAERLDHPNEALSLYERATEAEPGRKEAWTSRGLALLATGRPSDAQTSFDRALGLDSDYAPAKDGKKLAIQRTRDAQVQKYGREALLLEARVGRSVTKNDLFVTLHVPYEFLEPTLTALGRTPKVDLDRLEAAEVHDLENASYHLITTALERRPPGIERRGFTLADVAVLAPPSYSLDQIQRLFGYLRAVLEANLRPENLSLSPDVEELARKALVLPPAQRTLFQIVRTLRVGIYKARLIKVVEEAGAAAHAPLPTLDLGAYSPEFRGEAAPAAAAGAPAEAEVAPETPMPTEAAEEAAGPTVEWTAPVVPGPSMPMTGPPSAEVTAPRCVGCNGLASVYHACGVPLCQHCIGQFPKCPKCGQPVTAESVRPLPGVTIHAAGGPPAAHAAPSAPVAHAAHPARPAGPLRTLKGVFSRSKLAAPHPEPPAPKPEHPTRSEHPAKVARPVSERPKAPTLPLPKKEAVPAKTAAPAGAEEPATEAPPPPRPKREKDDEPRL